MEEAELWPADTATPVVAVKTVYRALLTQGLRNFRSKRRPKINRSTALLRLKYYRDWRYFNYKRVTVKFSDECSVARGSGHNQEWSFQYPDEKFDHNKVYESSSSQPKQQMVWGSVWCTPEGRVGRSPLVIMTRDFSAKRHGYTSWSYCNALEEGLLLQYKPGQMFMQDNARVHTSKYTKKWLESHGIWTIEHPPYSPDLNPIEHMWWALKRKLHQLHPEFDTLGDSQEEWDRFCEGLKEAWLLIPDSLIKRLIYSMPKRLKACKNAQGYQTKY
jgi:transposase